MRIWLILILSFWGQMTWAQSGGIKTIPSEYRDLNTTPWVFTEGDTLIIETDSVYVVNSERYHFYRKVHREILSSDDSTCSELLRTYERRLEYFDTRYQEMAANSHAAQMITLGVLQETNEKVEEIQIDLELTRKELEQSRKSLEEANRELDKDQSRNRKKVLVSGVIGLGIGLILGILTAS